jgi:hypothetical protein
VFLLPLFAIAIVVLLLLGGKVGRFAEVRLTHPWLAFVGVFGTHFAYKSGLYYGTPWAGRAIWLASILAIGLCMYLNRRHGGLLVACLGAMSNALVITANGGRMPTGRWGFHMLERMPAWYREPGIVGGDPQIPLPWTSSHTHLNFLADVLPPVFPLGYPFSVGDALLGIGIIWFLAKVMLGKVERPAAKAEPRLSPQAVLATSAVPRVPVAAQPSPAPVVAPVAVAIAVPAAAIEATVSAFEWTFAELGAGGNALDLEAA